MSEITLSKAVRSNLLSLQNTSDLLSKTQERLATGLKVSSALDNPTNFFTASALNSRASDLGRLQDSISNANQTLEAADNGLSAITKLVESAQATARQALQTASTIDQTTGAASATRGTTSFAAVDLSNAADPGSASTFTAASTFTNIDLTDDAGDALTFDIDLGGTTVNITLDRAGSGGGGAGVDNTYDIDEAVAEIQAQLDTAGLGVTVGKDGAGTSLTFTADAVGATALTVDNVAVTDGGAGGGVVAATSDLGISDPTTTGQTNTGTNAVTADSISFALTVGSTTQTITLDSTTTAVDSSAVTADEIAAAINAQFGSSVADGSSGEVVITDSATGTSSVVTVGTVTSTGNASLAGFTAGTTNGTDTSTTSVTNPKRDEFVSQYNELLGQIDQLAKDSGFNGVNLLNGDSLEVLFNEDGSSKLDIAGVTYDSSGLGLSAIASGGFNTNTAINSTLDTLKDGIDTLRTQSSTFGSNLSVVEIRENFTKSTINTLETGAANLTLADTNEEAANLLALQTRQQLSSTALSLASQADQQVLRLF